MTTTREPLELWFKGAMVSGKNQQRTAWIHGRPIKFPNQKFKAWRADFQSQMAIQVRGRPKPLFAAGVAVAFGVEYWPGDGLRRDMSGIMDALFHALEHKNGGVAVEDDSQFKQCLGWREFKPSKAAPRLIVRMREADPLP